MDHPIDLTRLPRSVRLGLDADGRAELTYLDERFLPGEERFCSTGSWREVVDAIKTLAVRGAPAIGAAGAAAVALWAVNEGARGAVSHGCAEAGESFLAELRPVAAEISAARPTAVNLMWATARMESLAKRLVAEGVAPGEVADFLFDEVLRIEREDEAVNRAIGAAGAALVPESARILTHCNAGSLATVFFGTALGVVYAAAEQGKVERVFADETRPVGQGARLTSWELSRAGVPVTVICDNMAASLMGKGMIDFVVVGADRITANGDVANKIGTYGVAVLARHHGIPFYVAAPASTFDVSLPDGSAIPIEERDPSEVLPQPIDGVDVCNPAFDVTPAELVSGIITEFGVFPPQDAAREVAARVG